MQSNFPSGLQIQPLLEDDSIENVDEFDQANAIERYGIAGRVWEATLPLCDYLSLGPRLPYDPPCPIHASSGPRRLLELGSGQAKASLFLANSLGNKDTLVLTDLSEVIPLTQRSVTNWEVHDQGTDRPAIHVEALSWGDKIADSILKQKPFDFILMCDLTYFPHLYPPLLLTLLELTEQSGIPTESTLGSQIIMSYKRRSLVLEQPFFDAFNEYFEMIPVNPIEGDVRMFICRRWRVTEEWKMPSIAQVMHQGHQGVVRGRDFGFVDQLYASIEI